MGKLKRGFNWKARLSSDKNFEQVNSPVKDTVQVDIDVREEQYDSSNALVLPSKREKAKLIKKKFKPAEKILSKKQRKHLEKIVEKKKRKIDRSELLEKLQMVQATSEELELMTATHFMQTIGQKRYNLDKRFSSVNKSQDVPLKISNLKGTKRKKLSTSAENSKRHNIDAWQSNDFSTSSAEEDNADDSPEPSFEVSNTESSRNYSEIVPEKLSNEQNAIVTKNEEKAPISSGSKSLTSLKVVEKLHSEPAVFVPVFRTPEIQASREALPIYTEEQYIMEAIRENEVVIIHGATGTGKTTQVPQFLYEAGFTRNKKMIGITEPRRIAAVTMASRVSEEMNLPDAVSYHIRYEKTSTDDKTEIKFMTDGVLLKEIRHDFLLSKYSAIIVDEAHERSVFSDVLIGLLSRILLLRDKKGDPLKVIIMSATIRVEDFTENPKLFKQRPCLLQIKSRQYDVVLHFSTHTPTDYVEAAYKKVCKIHCQLPTGAILVFLTGENEVTKLCKLLRKTFPFLEQDKLPSANKAEEVVFKSPEKRKKIKKSNNESFSDLAPIIDLDNYSVLPLDVEGLQHQISDDDEDAEEGELTEERHHDTFEPLFVLPLYSILPTEEQTRIFKPPPDGARLCVVATNVAETSITIPGLKYVVDSGKVKTRVYDKMSGGISNFVITWTSKASANQRAGRAGRTEGGHCYRLYSSSVFEHEFPSFTPPDIQRTPVDDVLLQMKALGIDKVVNFPFPSPPELEALKAAEKRLVILGALQDLQKGQRFKDIEKWEYSAKITPLGNAMSRFPVSPHYSKMLLLSYKHEVIPLIIALVSALTVPEVFQTFIVPAEDSEQNADEAEGKRLWIGVKKIGAGKGKSFHLGDAMVLLRAIAGYEETKNKANFCSKFHIRQKAMVEIHKMRLQLTKEMNRSFKDLDLPLHLKMKPPTDEEVEKLRKILTASLAHHVARKVPDSELGIAKQKLRNAYKCLDTEEYVFIHPSSILHQEAPAFVIYQEIFQTSKLFMRNVIETEPEWLPGFAPNLCEFSLPLETPPPQYIKETDKILCSMTSTFGRWRWELPCVALEMPQGLTKYNWFCFFLLDGQVCQFFKQYKNFLISPATNMLKSWAKLLPRTRYILQAAILKEVDSKEALFKTWKTDTKYLLREYCEWLPAEMHMEVTCKWPPQV